MGKEIVSDVPTSFVSDILKLTKEGRLSEEQLYELLVQINQFNRNRTSFYQEYKDQWVMLRGGEKFHGETLEKLESESERKYPRRLFYAEHVGPVRGSRLAGD